jgi:hypothetical protein
MILERPHRLAGAIGALVATVLVAVYGRACMVRGPAASVLAAGPAPAVAAAPVAPSPSPASPAARADGAAVVPAIPTKPVPCFDDDRTQLVADGDRALVCWGERCLADLEDPGATVARPALVTRPPETVVDAERVCSGARCDRLGPRLRAAVAGSRGSRLSATRDHAAIVVGDRDGPFAVWNRAVDRPVDLGSPADDEGEVVGVEAIGDFLIVGRSCNEYCSAISQIIDPRGRPHHGGFAWMPRWGAVDLDIVAMDADHFVVFGLFGEITLIARDRAIASADLLPERGLQPLEPAPQVVRLDARTLVAVWCAAGGCHRTRISLDVGADGGRPEIRLDSDQVLPRCRNA